MHFQAHKETIQRWSLENITVTTAVKSNYVIRFKINYTTSVPLILVHIDLVHFSSAIFIKFDFIALVR